jgi:peptidoglycan/LPS O-acetylase OafA/YrhL
MASYSLMFLEGFTVWTFVAIVIRFGRKILDFPLPWFLGAPDIAYSVYLFHHLFITILAVLIAHHGLSGEFLFVLITLVTGAISIVMGGLISRNPILSFAFNGRALRASHP